VQIQVLLAGAGGGNKVQEANTKVARLQVFDESSGKVLGFVIAYKLYIRIKIRRVIVEEQIQWILLYIQRGLADIWKENVLEDLERGLLK